MAVVQICLLSLISLQLSRHLSQHAVIGNGID